MQVSRILTIKEQYLPEMMLIFQSSLYLGIFLNIPTFLQKYYFVEGGGGSLFAADVFFSVSAAALLLSALAVFGRRVLLAGIIGFILLSVVASYYMWFFDVVIGYGVIQAVFGTELSLIVESMGFGLLAFVCLFACLAFCRCICCNDLARNTWRPGRHSSCRDSCAWHWWLSV